MYDVDFLQISGLQLQRGTGAVSTDKILVHFITITQNDTHLTLPAHKNLGTIFQTPHSSKYHGKLNHKA